MKPLLQFEREKELTLKEIDAEVQSAALSGYGGIILEPTDWESLRGWCRSAQKRGLGLWLFDDALPVSGGGSGEVTSVSEFRPKELFLVDKSGLEEGEAPLWENEEKAIVIRSGRGFWGANPFCPDAAEAFLDCDYRPVKRELSRFTGYELRGMVTRFSPDPTALPYSEELEEYMTEKCGVSIKENAAALFFDGKNSETVRKKYREAVNFLFGETYLKRQREFCAENGMKLIGLSASAKTEKYLDIAASESLQSGAELIFADVRSLSFAERKRVINEIFAGGGKAAAFKAANEPTPLAENLNSLAEKMLSVPRKSVPAETGGLPKETAAFDVQTDKGAFKFLFNRADEAVCAELALPSENPEYIFDFAAEKTYIAERGGVLPLTLQAGGSLILADKAASALPLPPFTADGAEFSELSGEQPLPAVFEEESEAELKYSAFIPQGVGGKYLRLSGSFSAAFVKIGRRREALFFPPFAVPLFEYDGGRRAEITVYGAPNADLTVQLV